MAMKLRIDLRKGLAELVLIFIGITLALTFENWNTDNERRAQELILLSELLVDLQETKADLQNDILGAQNRLKQTEEVLRWFSGDEDYVDSLNALGQICFSGHELFATTTTYDSIQTIGMDLIRNDSIRSNTARFFEQALERVYMAEDRLFSLNLDYCWPIVYSNSEFGESVEFELGLTFPNRAGGVQSLVQHPSPQTKNTQELRNDEHSRAVMFQNYNYRLRTITFYKMAEESIDVLISMIVDEIAS